MKRFMIVMLVLILALTACNDNPNGGLIITNPAKQPFTASEVNSALGMKTIIADMTSENAEEKGISVTYDYYDGSTSKQEYTPDPNPEENKEDPLIYLYNTHQGEEYNGGVLSEYNVIPTVMLAAYRLREQLNNYGLNTIVETNNISEILRSNGWNYNSSYSASKILMTNALEENPTLKYFIDVHRDALPYESSILTYEGKTYAKVLLVIGQNHPGYLSNLALAEEVSNLINSKVPGLSKGVMQKPSSIFNQDFSPNTLLIEFGGQYNKISEINNTVAIVAEVLKEVITE